MSNTNPASKSKDEVISPATHDLSSRIEALEARNRYLLNLQRRYAGSKVTLEFDLADFDLNDTHNANLNEAEKRVYVKDKTLHKLANNAFFNLLVTAQGKKHELLEDLVATGQLPPSAITDSSGKESNSAGAVPNLVSANEQLNLKARRTNKLLGKFTASPWLLAGGIVLLLFWGGLPLLYLLSGGNLGGISKPGATVTITPIVSPENSRSRKTESNPATPTPSKTQNVGSIQDTTPNEIKEVMQTINFVPQRDLEVELEEKQQMDLASYNNQSQNLTATSTPQPWRTPSPKGGLNGPHGAFFAPSRLRIEALELDLPVIKAVTQLEAKPGVTDPSGTGLLRVTWPRPGEIVHLGAFAGESGNAIILANQINLSVLRRIQLNDTITLYDRQNNAFIYRVVPFGATGGAERIVDPVIESWIFASPPSTNPNLALLTIVVNFPQPVTPSDPNDRESYGGSVQGGLEASAAEKTARDDYTSRYKLAYRAVLAFYAPAKTDANANGTPVIVPDEIYEVRPSLPTFTPPVAIPTPNNPSVSPSPALSPAPDNLSPVPTVTKGVSPSPPSTPVPTGTVVIPGGLPNTGKGGGQPTINPKVQ
jgi:hypothetical protein